MTRAGAVIAVEPEGLGATLFEGAYLRGLPVALIGEAPTDEPILATPLPRRAIAASGHVNGGRVRITRRAYEKVSTLKGVTRNHLLHQVAAFGVAGAEQQQVGVLLAAFADGVLDAFADPRMRSAA